MRPVDVVSVTLFLFVTDKTTIFSLKYFSKGAKEHWFLLAETEVIS